MTDGTWKAGTDPGDHDSPASTLEAIVVDPDDIVAACKRNRRDEHARRRHVLRVSPPFEDELTARIPENTLSIFAGTEIEETSYVQ